MLLSINKLGRFIDTVSLREVFYNHWTEFFFFLKKTTFLTGTHTCIDAPTHAHSHSRKHMRHVAPALMLDSSKYGARYFHGNSRVREGCRLELDDLQRESPF